MADRPAAILYALAGSPPQPGALRLPDEVPSRRCRVCAGLTRRAVPYHRWAGVNFTDQNKLRYIAGTHVCEACVWAHAWNPPPGAPAAAPGKKGLNLRLFSHLYDARGYVFANKGDKPAIRDWLCAPKHGSWFAAVADTGQKHVLPWTPINRDAYVGAVRFEEQDVFLDCRLAREWCDATIALLTAGATKAEVETGDYRPETWVRAEAAIRTYERRFGAERGSAWFALTLWLSQRDEDAVAERQAAEKMAKEAKADGRRKARPGDRSRGRSGDGGEGRVPRRGRKRADALAADPGPSAPRDADERADARVGEHARDVAPARGPEQLSLLGDDPAV